MARRYFLSRRIEERSERGILIRPREKGEKEKRKRKKREKSKGTKYFRPFLEKNQLRGCVCPETGFHIEIYRSFKREREREREWHFFADNTAKDGDIPTGRHDDKSKRIILKYPFHMDIPISCCPFFRWIYVRQTLESTDTDPPFPFQRHPFHPTMLLRFLKIISRGKMFVSSSIIIYMGIRRVVFLFSF